MRYTAPGRLSDAAHSPKVSIKNIWLVSYRPLAINLLLRTVRAKNIAFLAAFLANSLLEPRDLLLRAASNSLRLADAF